MDIGQIYHICVDRLAEFVASVGYSKVVLGLSGGIDSSLVAVMAVDALGPENVVGILLPGPFSSDHSIRDAEQLANNLEISWDMVSIVSAYDEFAKAIAPLCPSDSFMGIASENTQARCRMVVLMALSNANGWMMLNTGNKSEAYMGYSTLYGDTAGAFAPIGGIYKTDVYRLAYWRNEQAEKEGLIPPIPHSVLVKPPSAELAPGQEDEKSLGVDYATLDRILKAYYEEGQEVAELIAAGFDPEQVASVIERAEAYAFKRALEPPYPDDRFYA